LRFKERICGKRVKIFLDFRETPKLGQVSMSGETETLLVMYNLGQ
jgi:hypothetical protein